MNTKGWALSPAGQGTAILSGLVVLAVDHYTVSTLWCVWMFVAYSVGFGRAEVEQQVTEDAIS